jgi:hypothetical protein
MTASADDAFALAGRSDDAVVEAFRRRDRAALHDRAGISLVLTACIRAARPRPVQEEGYSALLIAASTGKEDWIVTLANAGADRGRRGSDGKGIAELLPGR